MPANTVLPNYRTVYPERMDKERDYGGYWDTKEVGDALADPRYSHIRWRYFRTAALGVYQKLIKSIPIRTVFDTMNTLIRPIHTDFTEMTENEDFIKVAGFLYYQLYIQETIYVTYNFFDSPSNYILPPHSKEDVKRKIEELRYRGGFDIWVKMTEDELDGDIQFMHIETSLTVNIPKWRDKVAQIKWGATYCGNFGNWLSISIIYLALTNFLEQMIRLSGKRALISTNTNSEQLIERIEGMLNSYDNIIHLNLQDMLNIKMVEYVDGKLLDSLKDCIFHKLDRLMFEYGRVTNTNPKGERMTAAENFKDMSGIANRQKETLEYLISFAFQCKKLWGIELEFGVSGIPEKEALQEYSHPAQTPNTSALDFTIQAEGTTKRTPVGKRTPKKEGRGRTVDNSRPK